MCWAGITRERQAHTEGDSDEYLYDNRIGNDARRSLVRLHICMEIKIFYVCQCCRHRHLYVQLLYMRNCLITRDESEDGK